jgi:hypothetical protein
VATLRRARRNPPEGRMVWYGRIHRDITEFDQRVKVIIPEFDPLLWWGPCRWQSRDATTFPANGDECLLIFDNRRQPWVVAWWPFDA